MEKTNTVEITNSFVNGEVLNNVENGFWQYPDSERSQVNFKEGSFINGKKIGPWKYNSIDTIQTIIWDTIRTKNNYLVNLPNSHKQKENVQCELLMIEKNDPKNYIALIEISKQEIQSIEEYLKEVIKQVVSDTIEKAFKYRIRKTIMEDGRSYYETTFYYLRNEKYRSSFSYYFETESKILDFTIKSNKPENQFVFLLDEIAGNFFVDNKKFIKPSDFIKETIEIKYEIQNGEIKLNPGANTM